MYRMRPLSIELDAPLVSYARCTTGAGHHWRIDEARGPTSPGACKACRAIREFKNWIPEADYMTQTEHELAAAVPSHAVAQTA